MVAFGNWAVVRNFFAIGELRAVSRAGLGSGL